MNPLAAALAAIALTMGGVSVNVSGPSGVMPREPDPAHMEVMLPTRQIAMYMTVLMSNDIRWTVKKTVANRDGSYAITIKPPTSTALTVITVQASDLDAPIWWVGVVDAPPPPPPADDVPVDVPPPTPIDPNPVPTPVVP